jgi:hypothetical protein
MQVAGDCTHHDHNKDLLVELDIGPRMELPLQVAVQKSSTCSGYLVDTRRRKLHTPRYSSEYWVEW